MHDDGRSSSSMRNAKDIPITNMQVQRDPLRIEYLRLSVYQSHEPKWLAERLLDFTAFPP